MTDLKNIRPHKKFKILLIGDSCIDEYKIGTVDRLSPEAPVPVIKIVEEYKLPGMASNVHANFKNLGLDCEFVHNTELITKTRYIDKRSNQHLLRVDSEKDISQWDSSTSLDLAQYDAIVISDYNKGFLSYENIQYLINSASGPVFIDTKKRDLAKFSGDHVYIKINETEFNNRISMPDNLIVTLGSKGAMLKQLNKEKIFPTRQVEVMDVCGCGDTFLAALVTQYLFTNDIEAAILFANAAAGITVQHRGNYAPTYDELYGLINLEHKEKQWILI
jgi:D-beta-D-heptose 7-phosphate kinase/D-beta-D-heptose 1-phosphate adenosyltransferase